MKILLLSLILTTLSLNLFADEGLDNMDSESSEVVLESDDDSSSEESYSESDEADSSDLSEY